MWGQQLQFHFWNLHITPQTHRLRICLQPILHAYTGTTILLPACPPVSLHRSNNHYRYWNICQLSISTLSAWIRSRLTLGRRSLPRNPYAFGGMDSHHSFRYSYQHSHFCEVHRSLQNDFSPHRTLPYPTT